MKETSFKNSEWHVYRCVADTENKEILKDSFWLVTEETDDIVKLRDLVDPSLDLVVLDKKLFDGAHFILCDTAHPGDKR